MEPIRLMNVEVAYATESQQRIVAVSVKENTSIAEAIELSGILQIFPEIDLSKQKVGIFSKQKELTDKVQEGERIEIYRPLVIDPKEARKRKVKKKSL